MGVNTGVMAKRNGLHDWCLASGGGRMTMPDKPIVGLIGDQSSDISIQVPVRYNHIYFYINSI